MAAAIALAGTVLCRESDMIAAGTGLPRSLIGLTLLAGVTSLPELAVGISSVTLLFDMAILALDDALFLEGPILAHVSASLGITVFAAIGMTALTLLGMGRRVGAALCASYLLAAWLLQRAAA